MGSRDGLMTSRAGHYCPQMTFQQAICLTGIEAHESASQGGSDGDAGRVLDF